MKNKIIHFLFLLIATNTFSQIPTVEWQYYYGGTNFDSIYDQKRTPDGGYILIGRTNSPEIPSFHYGSDIFIVKIDSLGILEWQKAIGGYDSDSAGRIIITTTGDYIITGETSSNSHDFSLNQGMSDVFIMKVSPTGTVLWQKTYGGSDWDYSYSVIETQDGGFIIGGSSSSLNGDITTNNGMRDFWLLKINNSGIIEWSKNYGGSNNEFLFDLNKTSDGGYIMTGETYSTNLPNFRPGGDVLVVKTDGQGNLIWQKCYGGSNWDYGTTAIETSDGNFLIGGSTKSSDYDVTNFHGGIFDFWVLKITPLGSIIWQKTYGGSNGEQLAKIIETTDGNYIACGPSNSSDGDLTSNNGNYDMWLIKISSNNDLIWQKSFGVGFDEGANSLIQTSDGGYLISGETDRNGFAGSNAWLIKLSNETLGINDFLSENGKVLISPNPVIDHFKINNPKIAKILVVNQQSKIVKEFDKQDKYNISELAEGVYFVRLIDESNEITTFKIIKK